MNPSKLVLVVLVDRLGTKRVRILDGSVGVDEDQYSRYI